MDDPPRPSADEVAAQRAAKKAALAAKKEAAKAKNTGSNPSSGAPPAPAPAPAAEASAAPADADASRPSADEVAAQRAAKKAAQAAKKEAAKAKSTGVDTGATQPLPTAASDGGGATSGGDKPSSDEVAAQRAAKKAAQAAKKDAAKSKADGGKGQTHTASQPLAATSGAPSSSTTIVTPKAQALSASAGGATTTLGLAPVPNPAAPLPKVAEGTFSPPYPVALLAMHLQSFRVVGANARTVAVLDALRNGLPQTETIVNMGSLTIPNFELLSNVVKQCSEVLAAARPFPAGMQFALSTFRDRMHRTALRDDVTVTPSSAVERHLSDITAEICSATVETAKTGATCITDGDVILTYGRSSSVELALLSAASKADFTVIVVDSAPLYEGRGMLWRLQQRGVKVSYVLLTAVCAAMARCTRVLIGAVGVLQNGQVIGRAGLAAVNLVAKRFGKPLLCLCETYKFSERIWLAQEHGAAGSPGRYDITPKDLVDNIVSEIGFLHPTAIAAAIRDRNEREARTTDPF